MELIRRCRWMSCVILGLGVWSGADAAEAGTSGLLRAGAARRSLVPPFATQMGGFYDRTAKFSGVADPIYARALVCDSGSERLGFVAVDLLDVTKDLVGACRVEIEKRTGMPGDRVLIAASHNHSAPYGYKRVDHYGDGFNKALFQFLVKEVAQVVADAQAALVPAQAGYGSGRLEHFSRNRQQGNEVVIDPEVGVLKVTRAGSREVIATVFNCTGHPVVLGGGNLLLSAEWPGAAARTVEAVLGGVALFTQGACGDVTVHRSGPPLEEVRRLGNIVAGEVIKTAEMTQAADDGRLVSKFQPVEVELRKLPGAQLAEERLAESKKAYDGAVAAKGSTERIGWLGREVETAATTLRMARFAEKERAFFEDIGHTSVHVVQVGPAVMVGMPGELFVEYGLEMKQRIRQGKDRAMMLVGFADDYVGYIITPRARYTGGYEQAIAVVDETAGRALTEAAMQIVEQVVK